MRYFTLISFIVLFGCQSAPTTTELPQNIEKPTTQSLAEFKSKVKQLYTPADCFRTNFSVTISVPNQGAQTAAGLLRADNLNKRMRMVLTEPFLGITLSWITIKDGFAYLSNPRYAGVQKISLAGFELQSMGTNSIQLPFSLFQDLLYGGLPETIYDKATNWQKTDSGYSATAIIDGDTFIYNFNTNYRLEKILYKKSTGNYTADISLNGIFYDTIFPNWFAIQTYVNQRPSETMKISFQAADFKAWCKDEYFPVQ